jgi:hypothetical protein
MGCPDVGRLEKSIASAGGDLIIERALPVGATPLKVCSEDVVDTTNPAKY